VRQRTQWSFAFATNPKRRFLEYLGASHSDLPTKTL
jgi:hypothetical protein